MIKYNLSIIKYILVITFFVGIGGCSQHKQASPYFTTRGVILDVNDLSTADWPKMAKEAGLTTIATHITPKQVAAFITSERGQQFLAECKHHGIEVEHELHAMGDLLPRELFATDSTMFRMDEKGKRVKEHNLCVHSEKALQIVNENAVKYAKLLPSTTGRYFFWIDDGVPMCKCPKCSQFSDSDLGLMLENSVVQALREQVDPKATLAHLAYHNTIEAPTKVKPHEGVFLEFAPFHRSYKSAMSDTAAFRPEFKISHGKYLHYLDENLKVFPSQTAQVLEYWLDVSLFSNWKKPAVQLDWKNEMFQQDIDVYAKRGIKNITSFAVYIDSAYLKKYPDLTFLKEYGQGLKDYTIEKSGGE